MPSPPASTSSSLRLLATSLSATLALLVACSTDAERVDGDAPDASSHADARAPDDRDGSTSSDGSPDASGDATDGGATTGDAGDVGDAATTSDAGDGGWEPIPGAPCAVVGEIYERPCGDMCGKETASCSPSKVVTGFGQCVEPDDACAPGATEPSTACGYCGTTSRTCSAACAWVAEPCQGEVTAPDRCLAGTTEARTVGCTGGVTRPWTCNASCAWDAPAISCEEASRILTLGDAVGATTSRDFAQLDEKIKRLTAGSAPCNVSSITDSHYLYVELRNPNATAAKVDVGVSTVAGQPKPNVLVAAYASVPSDAAARRLCLNGAELSCNSNLAYAACLFGAKSPTVAPGGSAWSYVGNFQGADAPVTFNLSATITSL